MSGPVSPWHLFAAVTEASEASEASEEGHDPLDRGGLRDYNPFFLWDNGITMENPLKGLSNQGLLGGFGLEGLIDNHRKLQKLATYLLMISLKDTSW